MSKSLGNVYLIRDIKDKGYDPLVYKLFCYTSSYRNKLNFTWEGIEATSKSLERLRKGYQNHVAGNDILSEEDRENLNKIEENFHTAINDDMNMPLAMSYVWEAVKYEKKNKELADLLSKFDKVLGIKIEKEEKSEEIPEEILKLVEQRKIAREEKNWEESDRIRDEISNLGYNIKDTKNGVEIERKN